MWSSISSLGPGGMLTSFSALATHTEFRGHTVFDDTEMKSWKAQLPISEQRQSWISQQTLLEVLLILLKTQFQQHRSRPSIVWIFNGWFREPFPQLNKTGKKKKHVFQEQYSLFLYVYIWSLTLKKIPWKREKPAAVVIAFIGCPCNPALTREYATPDPNAATTLHKKNTSKSQRFFNHQMFTQEVKTYELIQRENISSWKQ